MQFSKMMSLALGIALLVPVLADGQAAARAECGLDRRPAVRIHRATQNSGSPFNSNASQARAERRSRFAVASEIPTAVALSSRDRPPK